MPRSFLPWIFQGSRTGQVTSRRSFLLGLAMIGCDRRPVGSAGRANRIVSLSPSTTEAVYALGLGKRLVGRSRYCDYPPEVKSLPAVGGFVDPSLEAILALKPDLVVGVQGPGLKDFPERLETRGIGTYFPPTQSLIEIEAMLKGLGQRTGESNAASRVCAHLEEQKHDVEEALRGLEKPRVLMVFGLRPVVVAGPGGFPDEMLRLAGGENVVKTERTRFPTLGIERVIALAPDIVVDTTGGAMREGISVTKDLPGWGEVRAVRNDRIVRISDDRVLRPGPRVGEGIAILAKALHPEAKLR